MLRDGICRPTDSCWSRYLHILKEKDRSWRVCGDYRRLNAVTNPDRYHVPHLFDIAHNLHGRSIFATLDMVRTYHQIPMEPDGIPKTAVKTPFGLYEFTVITFELRNAAQTFQRCVDCALQDLPLVYAYKNDLLIAWPTFKNIVSTPLGIWISNQPCKESQHCQCSGHRECGLSVISTKPSTILELLKFLGIINFYRHLPHAAHIRFRGRRS